MVILFVFGFNGEAVVILMEEYVFCQGIWDR
jgi:hypothetical protein